jgi:hypothetical protein
LQDELQSLEGVPPVSRSCKEYALLPFLHCMYSFLGIYCKCRVYDEILVSCQMKIDFIIIIIHHSVTYILPQQIVIG